ncbi:MAG: hypothetical protein Q9160_005958 [Pyrenula sp. 1 TL-2023]
MDKHNYESLPIPTYEEATSSRPPSSQSLGPQEISDDAERQGLLHDSIPRQTYRYPTVESARSSLDLLTSHADRHSEDALRQEMEQMDVEDPSAAEGADTPLIGNRISKRLSSFTQSLSSLHLPFRRYIPSFRLPTVRLGGFSQSESDAAGKFVIFGRLFGILLIVSVVYILVASGVLQFGQRSGQIYADPELLRQFVQSHMNEHGNMQQYLEYLTEYPHISGLERNYVLAEWMQEEFKTASLEHVIMERFDVYLNYPKEDGRRVAIVDPPEKQWEALLEEKDAYSDPPREQPYVFHGLSKTGNVTGPLIYANYGSKEDFNTLSNFGISVNGSVVIVRYGGTQTDRALKVKAAEAAGALGCIIYSDPEEDGFRKGKEWPEGRYRSDDSAQRGTVGLTSWVVGDVLSPGWAATPGDKHRLKPEESAGLVKIPSIPLAWRDARPLLQSIQGHGRQMDDGWIGGIPNVQYWSGDGSSPIVNLKNDQFENAHEPIFNIVGQITGWEQPGKKIIIGNHRDAWCFGAVDPSSGTAVMLEVIRIFGELKKLGWRPLRTIEFASWDAEEYNLIGSTEHVENQLNDIRLNGFAYVNVDVAVAGPNFTAAGSPVFEGILQHVLKRTTDPHLNQTLFHIWESKNGQLGSLGAGSDYVAFQDLAGTSSIDVTFEGEPFPYHSCYDNFEWMKNFGDPDFAYHKLMGEVIALLILELADKPILPFNLEEYATRFYGWVDSLKDAPGLDASDPVGDGNNQDSSFNMTSLDLKPLWGAAEIFAEEARLFHQWDQQWAGMYYGSGEFESNVLAIKRMSHNNRMANFETHLLDLEEGGGVPNRTQYKHVVFAPELWSGYDGMHFPGIRDALNVMDWRGAQKQIEKVADIVTHAARKLNHN